jgi:hypothetical protein
LFSSLPLAHHLNAFHCAYKFHPVSGEECASILEVGI